MDTKEVLLPAAGGSAPAPKIDTEPGVISKTVTISLDAYNRMRWRAEYLHLLLECVQGGQRGKAIKLLDGMKLVRVGARGYPVKDARSTLSDAEFMERVRKDIAALEALGPELPT